MSQKGVLENEFPKFIYNYGGDHLITEYIGTYASDEINSYIPLAGKLHRRHHYLPFMFVNTDTRNEDGTHWISLINICPSNVIFMFHSFGKLGLKNFITIKNIDLIQRFFKFVTKEKMFNVFNFNVNNSRGIDRDTVLKESISKYAFDLFNFFNEFADYNDIKENVKIFYIKNQIQDENDSFCSVYCLYFICNLFNPTSDSDIIEDKLCSIMTIQKLLKEIFSLDNIEENTKRIKNFAEEYNIKGKFE